MKISVFKDLYKSKDVPYPMELEEVVDRIKSGTSKATIEQIRNGDKNKKNSLPCILFAGEFTERNSNSLIQHSGLMVVDYDKYPDNESINVHLEELKHNPHFVLLFISPSGNGIKGVVKIPVATKDSHPKYFKAFYKKFHSEYFDIANCNVDRVCFESYDANIYVNYDAELFNAELIDEGYTLSEKVPVLPINDEGKIIEKIMAFNWKRGFNDGERNAFIFDLAGAFCEYGVSAYTAEGYILNNVVIGDFSETEAKTTIKSAYAKRQFDSKFFEDYIKLDRIKSSLKNGKKAVMQEFGITEQVYEKAKDENDNTVFWSIDDKGKVSVNSLKYKLFLENNGFKKYFPFEAQIPTLVYVYQNKVVETSIEKIKDFVLKYLLDKKEEDVWIYCSKYNNMFSEQYLLMLETVEFIMLKDTKEASYIAYKNGILEVKRDNAKLIKYIDIDGYIWEKQIINRDFINLDKYDNEYQTFISNISNKEPLPLESVIGYLLSSYKNKTNNKAVILNDEVISDNPEGGTGKGLFVQGISKIRNVSILDGKTFDDKKSFAYQTLSSETQVLVFDDVVKNFNFEHKFSLVTEGMTLERKNKDAIKLSVEDSPKMVISTNYAIKGEGNSHDRRRWEVEVAQYYGKDLNPIDEFGHQLFDDWDNNEFSKFDNYMVYCLQTFLKFGLIPQNAKNIKERKFIAETDSAFNEYMSDFENVPRNVRNDKQIYLDNFKREYPDWKNYGLSSKRFQIWIQKYCNYKGFKYSSDKSNGMYWFMIEDGKKQEEEDNDLAF